MFSLSLLIILQSKTLLKKTADSADYVKEVAENVFADVGPDGAAEEGEREQNLGIISIRYLITHLEIY